MDRKGILKYDLGMRMLFVFTEDIYIYLILELHEQYYNLEFPSIC